MKIKFNHIFCVYFMNNNNMSFNIDVECAKLVKIINDETFAYALDTLGDKMYGQKINFLMEVLMLTSKYPQVESYLEDLLNYFTINELEKIGSETILHNMARYSYTISLGAFEIIMDYVINIDINIQNRATLCTAIHLLLYTQCTEHHNNILNLFIKHGANLNIANGWDNTVLDMLTYHHQEDKLSEETQKCAMILIDFGATTNNPRQDTKIYNFVEYYKSSTIKPAIKK